MKYHALATEMVDVLDAMTPLQREGVRRTFNAPNLMLEENADLWRCFAPSMQIPSATMGDTSPLVEVRAALEELSLESWRTVNNILFLLQRGNVFDEPCTYLEGGGIEFDFVATRYGMFFDYLKTEAEWIGGEVSILDVGCWQGTLICELLQRGYAAGGTDICGEAEGVLVDRLLHLRPEHKQYFLGYHSGWAHEELTKMPEKSWDIVVSQETLEHVPASVLRATCDQMLRVARYSVLVEVPFEDGWPMHLRIYTLEDLERLFIRPGWGMEVLVYPASQTYTTIKMVRNVE